MKLSVIAIRVFGGAAALLPAVQTNAQSDTWDGGGGDNLWGSGANWADDGAPSPGTASDLFFGGTTRPTPVNNYTNGDDFRNITFNAGAGAFTISNTGTNGIDWFGSIDNNSTNIQTIGFRLYQSLSNSINATSGNVTLNSSALIFRNGRALTFNAASGMVIAVDSVIENGGGGAGTAISIPGAGTVSLNGANTFTSGVSIISGSVGIGNNAALGSGVLNLGGTNANTPTIFASGGARTIANNVTLLATSVGGNPTINGSNDLTIAGVVTASEAPRILTVDNTGSTMLSGNVFLSNNNTTGGRGLTINGTGNTTASGAIANNNSGNTLAATLTKSGAGVLTLSGSSANSYTGVTTVNGGTLLLAKTAGTNAIAGNIKVGDGTGTDILALGADNQIANSSGMELAGGVIKAGAGFDEGAGAMVGAGMSTPGIGALTLTASSTLDFNGDSGQFSTLVFTSFAPGAFNLAIDNWTGSAFMGGSTVGDNAGSDRLIFASSQSANLGKFLFTGFATGATEIALADGSYEIVPVPEPSVFAAALGLLGLIGWREMRRR